MAPSPFVDQCLERFGLVGPATARAMFGGHGIYCHGVMCGLVADDVLYVKVDPDTEAAFREAGQQPFVYEGKGRAMTMSYWTVPDAVWDEDEAAGLWLGRGVDAAQRQARAKASKPATRRPGRSPS